VPGIDGIWALAADWFSLADPMGATVPDVVYLDARPQVWV